MPPDAHSRSLRDLLSALKRGLIDAPEARSSVRGRLERGGPLEAGGLADLLGLNEAGQGDDELRLRFEQAGGFQYDDPGCGLNG